MHVDVERAIYRRDVVHRSEEDNVFSQTERIAKLEEFVLDSVVSPAEHEPHVESAAFHARSRLQEHFMAFDGLQIADHAKEQAVGGDMEGGAQAAGRGYVCFNAAVDHSRGNALNLVGYARSGP